MQALKKLLTKLLRDTANNTFSATIPSDSADVIELIVVDTSSKNKSLVII